MVGAGYAFEPLALLYLMVALAAFAFGAALLLYERFTDTSRRVFVLATIAAGWLVPLGMAALATDAPTAELWLRVAFVIDPFTAPALYWLAAGLVGRDRPAIQRMAWLAAVAFSMVGLTGPWLVEGLIAVTRNYTLAGGGWLGALYFLYISAVVVAAVADMGRARQGPHTREEREGARILTAAAAIAGLTLLDYWAPTELFRVGVVTPLAFLTALLLGTVVALRHRAFSLAHTFGTDEVLRAMSDGVLVCDSSGRVRGSNPAAQQLLGRDGDTLLNAPLSELFAMAESGALEEWPQSAGSELRDLRLVLLRSDGERIAVSVSTEPLRMAGRAVGLVIVARDMRDRLEAERAMRASERRYHSLFWNNPGSVYEFDLEGRFVAANPAVEGLLGVRRGELLGRPFIEIIEPGSLEQAAVAFDTAVSGRAAEYELSVLHSDGGTRKIRGVSIPIVEEGTVAGVFGIAMDVTDQTRIKQELEVQRRYFADLFEGSPEGIVLVEAASDRVIRVNQEFSRMFGYTAEEAVGRNLNDLIVPDDLRWEGSDLNGAARSGGRVKAETVRRRKDGSAVQVSVLARHLQIPGEDEQLYGVYRDISDRMETERALREREEELRHSQKLEAVGKLAGGIAHDFNNLLTVINGHARFALETVRGGDPVEQDLLEIEKAGARAASLTQQLLAYSRRQVLHPQLLDSNAVVLEVKGMLGRLIGEHIRVETRLTSEDVRVRVDRGQLEQVLVNLVVNARDAMPEGGTVTLETETLTVAAEDPRVDRWEIDPGDFVRIRVSDTGTGMDPETLEHAFEPFFTTKPQGKGTGLGLATVFGIVKQSGGHVVVSSQLQAGTVCEVILPRSTADTAPGPREVAERALEPEGTVLVVEDEAAVRNLAVRVLERAGCTVLSAENGARALEVIESHAGELDLVLSDLVMPVMGGRELAAQLLLHHPSLPILFMSGYDDEFGPDLDDGHAFLAKPFTPSDLARRVAEAIQAGADS